MKITVLGAGAWGTAIAVSLSARHEVVLWGRDSGQCRTIAAARRNQRYLPEIELPAQLTIEAGFAAAVHSAELILVATPTAALRDILLRLAPTKQPIVWLSKGFDPQSANLPHQIAAEVLGPGSARGVLSGPSFALEVARGLPTALTLASADAAFSQVTARALHGVRLRVYFSTDIAGVEIGGAVKNVMAIATGIADGLGLGANARAALITRGLAEITRLGVKLGGRPELVVLLQNSKTPLSPRRPRAGAGKKTAGHPARIGTCGRGRAYRRSSREARAGAGHRDADHRRGVLSSVWRRRAARSGGAVACPRPQG